MAEDTTQTQTPPADATPPEGGDGDAKKFAGKYETPDALEGGIREIRKELGLDDVNGSVIGKDGLFSSVEAAERGYLDYRKMMGQRGQQKPAEPPKAEGGDDDGLKIPKPDADAADPNATVDQILEKAGLKSDDIAQQWQAEGKLSDEQYDALAKLGHSRAVVDTFIRGQQADAMLQQQAQQQIKQNASQLAGGEQQLQTLLTWAGNNYTEQQIAAIDQQLGDPNRYEAAIKSMLYDHQQAVGAGKTQPLVNGGSAPPRSSAPKNRDEVNKILAQAQSGNIDSLKQLQSIDLKDLEKMYL